MPLGGNSDISKEVFVEVMRTRLKEEFGQEISKNVDKPEARPNLEALGQAVYNILTTADTHSSKKDDEAFWKWIQDVNAWLTNLSTWQKGVKTAFESWSPTSDTDKTLKTTITKLRDPGDPPDTSPTEIKGKIQ
jgi:molecular chaperone DnaK (HSP70)